MRNHIVKLSIEHDKEMPNGQTKKVSEWYLSENIEDLWEAEKKAFEFFNENCTVNSIARLPESYKEIVNEDEKKIYIASIVQEQTDDNGNPKEFKYNVFVRADNITEAHNIMNEYLKQGLSDMTLITLKKTKYVQLL